MYLIQSGVIGRKYSEVKLLAYIVALLMELAHLWPSIAQVRCKLRQLCIGQSKMHANTTPKLIMCHRLHATETAQKPDLLLVADLIGPPVLTLGQTNAFQIIQQDRRQRSCFWLHIAWPLRRHLAHSRQSCPLRSSSNDLNECLAFPRAHNRSQNLLLWCGKNVHIISIEVENGSRPSQLNCKRQEPLE